MLFSSDDDDGCLSAANRVWICSSCNRVCLSTSRNGVVMDVRAAAAAAPARVYRRRGVETTGSVVVDSESDGESGGEVLDIVFVLVRI